MDEQFLTLPKEACLKVWRIEDFMLVPWSDIGGFHVGDAYLVYHAYTQGTSARIIRDIYFWLGSECTQDESGTAAIKAVELDDYFDGVPIQHREVEGHESQKFIKLFEEYGGIRYLDGGIASGFRPVSVETTNMLFQVKGRRNPVLKQVPCNGSSLNQGDAFILSAAGTFFLWLGKEANPMEKMKAASVLDKMKAKQPKWKVVRLEDGETSPEFWAALGGETPIASATEGDSDEEHEASNKKEIYELRGEEFVKIAEGAAAQRSKLTDNGLFVIKRDDMILVYVGKSSAPEIKKNPMAYGLRFLNQFGLPNYLSIAVAKGGVESDQLDILFA